MGGGDWIIALKETEAPNTAGSGVKLITGDSLTFGSTSITNSRGREADKYHWITLATQRASKNIFTGKDIFIILHSSIISARKNRGDSLDG